MGWHIIIQFHLHQQLVLCSREWKNIIILWLMLFFYKIGPNHCKIMIIYLFNHAAQLQIMQRCWKRKFFVSTTILQSTCTTSSMPLSLFCPLFHRSPEWLCCGTNQVVVGTGNLWHCWLLQQCRWIHLGQNRNAGEIQWMIHHACKNCLILIFISTYNILALFTALIIII